MPPQSRNGAGRPYPTNVNRLRRRPQCHHEGRRGKAQILLRQSEAGNRRWYAASPFPSNGLLVDVSSAWRFPAAFVGIASRGQGKAHAYKARPQRIDCLCGDGRDPPPAIPRAGARERHMDRQSRSFEQSPKIAALLCARHRKRAPRCLERARNAGLRRLFSARRFS
jgi:hypothetical protein